MSTRPGVTSRPRTSIAARWLSGRAFGGAPGGAIDSMRPPRMVTSAMRSVPATGSTTVPPSSTSSSLSFAAIASLTRRRPPERAGVERVHLLGHPLFLDLARLRLTAPPDQDEERRHPHGDAVRHLVHDHRVRPVGDGARDLDAAVHRPGMEDDDVG